MKLPRINSITISGRLVNDPELKHLGEGTPLCVFTIAQDTGYMKNNEWQSKPCFVEVKAWRKTAEICHQKLEKGSMVIVEGGIEQEAFQTKEGQNRRVIKINAMRVHVLENEVTLMDKNKNEQKNEITEDNVPF